MQSYRPLLLILVFAVTALLPCRAQQPTPPPAGGDSSSVMQRGDTIDQGFRMTKSPTLAILYSIVPGGGQLYNHDYWKIPLFLGAATFFAVRTVYYHNQFLDKADQYDTLSATSLETLGPGIRRQREFYRDNRDLNFAYFLGVEILNMIDAYVGAHLFDFNVDDDISSRIYLDPQRIGIGVAMQW